MSDATAAADVFISYKRSDLERVRPLAEALQAAGLSVWYDARLESGSAYDAEITRALRAAKTVLVCWSKDSVESEWVRAEATEGRARGVLASVLLEPCQPYPPFNLIHHEDLSGWRGDPDARVVLRLVDTLARRASGEAQLGRPGRRQEARGQRRRGGFWVAAIAAAVAAVAVALVLRDPPPAPAAAPPPSAQAPAAAPIETPPPPEADAAEPMPPDAPPVETTAPAAASPDAARAEPGRFRPQGEGQRFGRAEQFDFTIAFTPGEPRTVNDATELFQRLTQRFAEAEITGVRIVAPQAQDEARSTLRSRRLSAISQAFIRRGVTPRTIVIEYAPAADAAFDSVDVTIYYRPIETEAVP